MNQFRQNADLTDNRVTTTERVMGYVLAITIGVTLAALAVVNLSA